MALLSADDNNFNSELANHQKVIVKYYADWCGSCKLFAPKFKRLSGDERFVGIHFLKVDAEKSPEARKAAGVDSLPFFAIFKDGQFVEGLATSKEEVLVALLEKFS